MKKEVEEAEEQRHKEKADNQREIRIHDLARNLMVDEGITAEEAFNRAILKLEKEAEEDDAEEDEAEAKEAEVLEANETNETNETNEDGTEKPIESLCSH